MVSPFTHAIGALVVVLSSHPAEDVARERVDLIEVNHFFDEQGRLVFDQVIFYDWSGDHSRYMVRDWRLVKNASQLPQRDWQCGGYLAVWQDGEVMRRVGSEAMRETWTQYDPELVEREYLPKDERRKLRSVKVERLAQRSERPPEPAAETTAQSTQAAAGHRAAE
jgi:1,4-dihydroxy-2-naphthoyl-CoA synthase